MAAQDVKRIVAAADACGLADNKASLVAFTLVSVTVAISTRAKLFLLFQISFSFSFGQNFTITYKLVQLYSLSPAITLRVQW